METTTLRVPRQLVDEVTDTMNQRWKMSRSQATEQAIKFFLKLRAAHPDLPLRPENPLPKTFAGVEVWLSKTLCEQVRDICRQHNQAQPDAPEVRLGHVAQTALLHAKASLIAHGHRSAS